MHVGGEHDLISLDEEAGGLEADEEILVRHHLREGVADLGFCGPAAGRRAPGGQIVRPGEGDGRLTVRVGDHRWRPEGGVGEGRADSRGS